MNSIVVKDADGNAVTIAARPPYSVLHLTAADPSPDGSDVTQVDGSALIATNLEMDAAKPICRIPMREAGFSGLALRAVILDPDSGDPILRVGLPILPGVPGVGASMADKPLYWSVEEADGFFEFSPTSLQPGDFPFVNLAVVGFDTTENGGLIELYIYRW